MSFADNKTKDLWQSFMPRRSEITNRLGNEFYSLEVYDDPHHFRNFDPGREFDKWAAVAVSDARQVPAGMELLTVPAGSYAVFPYKGDQQQAERVYRQIFQEWLPQSGYTLDHRPHFAVMGEKYKNNSADSEEEIWIPITT
jgi:AraC family transcriptional regulator